jgi:hypothetical protein
MKMTVATLLVTLGLLLGGIGCGDGDDDGTKSPTPSSGNVGGNNSGNSYDNVAACKAWVSSITCGSFDPSTVVQCDSYANLTCDISGYFDCLTQNFKCTNDIPDPSGLAACIDKAKCQ